MGDGGGRLAGSVGCATVPSSPLPSSSLALDMAAEKKGIAAALATPTRFAASGARFLAVLLPPMRKLTPGALGASGACTDSRMADGAAVAAAALCSIAKGGERSTPLLPSTDSAYPLPRSPEQLSTSVQHCRRGRAAAAASVTSTPSTVSIAQRVAGSVGGSVGGTGAAAIAASRAASTSKAGGRAALAGAAAAAEGAAKDGSTAGSGGSMMVNPAASASAGATGSTWPYGVVSPESCRGSP